MGERQGTKERVSCLSWPRAHDRRVEAAGRAVQDRGGARRAANMLAGDTSGRRTDRRAAVLAERVEVSGRGHSVRPRQLLMRARQRYAARGSPAARAAQTMRRIELRGMPRRWPMVAAVAPCPHSTRTASRRIRVFSLMPRLPGREWGRRGKGRHRDRKQWTRRASPHTAFAPARR